MKMEINEMKVKILGIVGSPRKGFNTEVMVKEALKGAQSVGSVETELYSLAGRKISPCNSCFECFKEKKCIISDDFQDFASKYVEADGLIIGSPVYHSSVTAQLKAALDRLGNMLCVKYDMQIPRLCKAGGAVVQGLSRWGGQEYVVSFIINHFLLMKNVPVAPDLSLSESPGASGQSPQLEVPSIMKDEQALKTAFNLGKRVAEMAKILQAGRLALGDKLPKEYFPPKTLL